MDAAQPLVGRLAPSPTGAQHLGNARTYILAWLSVRSRGGRMILRIEDIDSPRVKNWAVRQAIDDLHWLGLDWDEGPDEGGPAGTYIQTERKDSYQEILNRLIASGTHLFPCACTRRDIEEAASAPHENLDGPIYPGTCAEWKPGDPMPDMFSWRFRCRNQPLSYGDLVVGRQTLNPAKSLGDFPITRKTGDTAYQLAVVADDIAMGVTEVFRGDDLIPSTFRQLDLYHALESPAPDFAHVPLVIGENGWRLAKRHGDTRMSSYREKGVRAETIVGWAAWSAGLIDRWEDVSVKDLLPLFDFAKINPERPVVDASIRKRLDAASKT